MNVTASTRWGRGRLVGSRLGLALFCLLAIGCARLPVPIQVIHEDQRMVDQDRASRKRRGLYPSDPAQGCRHGEGTQGNVVARTTSHVALASLR